MTQTKPRQRTQDEKFVELRQRAKAKRDRDRDAREAAATGQKPPRPATPVRTPLSDRPNALATAPPELLFRADLKKFYGIPYSRATLYRWIAAGKFPRPVVLGTHRVWHRSSIENWLRALKPADAA